jgi:hypothetical protein
MHITPELTITPKQFDLILSLNTPEKVSEYMNHVIKYDMQDNYSEDKLTNRSFIKVLRENKAHCLEGALFAAGVMYFNGYPPFIISIDAPKDHSHNIFVYRDKKTGKIGSLAMSRDQALRQRKAAYNTLNDLMMSYYNVYTEYIKNLDDVKGQIIDGDAIFSMRGYSQLINLEDYQKKGIDWICGENNLDIIEEDLYLHVYRHITKGFHYITPDGVDALPVKRPISVLFDLPKAQPVSLIHLK